MQPVGLPNPGTQQCYLNSVLQSLHASRRYTSYLQELLDSAGTNPDVTAGVTCRDTQQQARAADAISSVSQLVTSLASLFGGWCRPTIVSNPPQPTASSLSQHIQSYSQESSSFSQPHHMLQHSDAPHAGDASCQQAEHSLYNMPVTYALYQLMQHMQPCMATAEDQPHLRSGCSTPSHSQISTDLRTKQSAVPMQIVRHVISALSPHMPGGRLQLGEQQDALEAAQAIFEAVHGEALGQGVGAKKLGLAGLTLMNEQLIHIGTDFNASVQRDCMHGCTGQSGSHRSQEPAQPQTSAHESNGRPLLSVRLEPQPAEVHLSTPMLRPTGGCDARGAESSNDCFQSKGSFPVANSAPPTCSVPVDGNTSAQSASACKQKSAASSCLPVAKQRASLSAPHSPAQGWLSHRITCCRCRNQSVTQITPFWSLSLKLPVRMNAALGTAELQPGANLMACLQSYVQPCVLDGVLCNKCSLKSACQLAKQHRYSAGPPTSSRLAAAKLAAGLTAGQTAMAISHCTNDILSRAGEPEVLNGMSVTASGSRYVPGTAPMSANGSGPTGRSHSSNAPLVSALAQMQSPLPDMELHQVIQDAYLLDASKVRGEAVQQVAVCRLPSVLALHVQRSIWDMTGHCIKVHGHISFPLSITAQQLRGALGCPTASDTSAMVLDSDVAAHRNAAESDVHIKEVGDDDERDGSDGGGDSAASAAAGFAWHLISVVCHVGLGSGYGHYVVYRRGALPKPQANNIDTCANNIDTFTNTSLAADWYRVSDSVVQPVDVSDVLSSHASVLLYERDGQL